MIGRTNSIWCARRSIVQRIWCGWRWNGLWPTWQPLQLLTRSLQLKMLHFNEFRIHFIDLLNLLIGCRSLTDTCWRSNWICIWSCCNWDGGGLPRRTPLNCDSNSAIGSTDSRPDGDSADKPLDELKCMFERRGRGPPNARPECGIRRTPPWRIADGSSYICG